MQLQEFFKQNPRIAVAFSGGVDSSYLLYAAYSAGCDVHAYLINSEFQPQFEIDEAISIAKKLDVPLTICNLSILDKPDVVNNTQERCYFCKTHILNKLWELAREDGYTILCDGTNADDDETDRPGMRALKEQGVISPIRLYGQGKQEIRRLSKQAGLPTHDKPAYACLATRIHTGTAITQEMLTKVERAENALFSMGFSDFRVRYIPDNTAKIQMPADFWDEAAERRKEINSALQSDFNSILLDLTER